MRKLVVLFLVSCLVSVGLATTAGADTFLGEFCWQKTPFPDIVKLALSVAGSQVSAHGVQFVNGSYVLPFTGTLFVVGSQAILGGVFVGGDFSQGHFGDSVALSETVLLSTSTGSGPGTITGIDGKFPPTASTWTFIPCPSGPNSQAVEGLAPAAQGG
jgi:hypothetical protein